MENSRLLSNGPYRRIATRAKECRKVLTFAHTENWKDLFQPQSVNSALLAKVWFSPSWSHFSEIWAKKATSKGYSSPGTNSALANWPWFKRAKLDSKLGLYITHRNGPLFSITVSYFWLAQSAKSTKTSGIYIFILNWSINFLLTKSLPSINTTVILCG